MRTIEFICPVKVAQMSELTDEQRVLVEKAKESTKLSYSPYSHFSVGAAVLLNDGKIFTGANQENAAYPSGLCAERTAMFYANAQCPQTPVKALAIACYTGGHFTENPSSPCGNCRQVLLETEHRFKQNMEIILYGEKEVYIFESAKSLLPHSFVEEDLKG